MRRFCLVAFKVNKEANNLKKKMEDGEVVAARIWRDLQERVERLERFIHGPSIRVIKGNELHESRMDYENLVRHQWLALTDILFRSSGYEGELRLIVNTKVMESNVMRLSLRGYQCKPIPFTNCTELVFMGYEAALTYTTNTLEDVD